MNKPIEYNDLAIYQGTDFVFSFRLSEDGTALNPANISFKIATSPDAVAEVSLSLTDSPPQVELSDEEENIYTVSIPKSQTVDIDPGEYYFQIDVTYEDTDLTDRWMIGALPVYAGVI
jgi:hypothetical protein